MKAASQGGASLVGLVVSVAIAVILGVVGRDLLYNVMTGGKTEKTSFGNAKGHRHLWESYAKFPPIVTRNLEPLKSWGKRSMTPAQRMKVLADVCKSLRMPADAEQWVTLGVDSASGSAIVAGGLVVGINQNISYIIDNDSKLVVVARPIATKNSLSWPPGTLSQAGSWLAVGPTSQMIVHLGYPSNDRNGTPKFLVNGKAWPSTVKVHRNVDVFAPIEGGGGAGVKAKRNVMKGVVTSPKGEKWGFEEIYGTQTIELKLGPYALHELDFR